MDSQLPQSTLSTTNEEKMTSYGFEYATVTPSPPKRRAGYTKFQETRHPVFSGVCRRAKGERWICEMRDTNKNNNNKSRIWLGPFPTAEMAARAHDVAVMALRGQNACLNFADSAWRFTVPCSASREDIRRALQLLRKCSGHCPLRTKLRLIKSRLLRCRNRSTVRRRQLRWKHKTTRLMLRSLEVRRDAYNYWKNAFREQYSTYRNSYSWEDHDMECRVADVSLWIYSI